ASQDPLNYPIRLNNKLASLGDAVASADAAPTDQSYQVYDELAAAIDRELAKLDRVVREDLAAFNKLVRDHNVPAVTMERVSSLGPGVSSLGSKGAREQVPGGIWEQLSAGVG